MHSHTASHFQLAWTRTADGVVVLRYLEDWVSERDLSDLLLPASARGAPPRAVPLLMDLRALPGAVPAPVLQRFVGGLPDLVRRLPQRRAYLVRDDAQEGLARMIQARTEPLQFEAACFTGWDEALDWLREVG